MHDKTAFLARSGTRRADELAVRFAVDYGVIQRVEMSEVLAGCSIGARSETRFATRFLDTPKFDLKAASLELCVARHDAQYYQITKSKASKANSYKPSFEVETELRHASDMYRPIGTSFGAEADRTIQQQEKKLQCYLRLETERKSKEVSNGQVTMRWIVEHGENRSGFSDVPTGRQPFHHLILSYVSGDVRAYFGLVRCLARECQLQVTGLTAEQIGRGLLKGHGVPYAKAEKYVLSPESSARDVAQKAFGVALKQISGNREAAAAGHPEGIKQLRVGLRRLRSLERLFRKSLKDPVFRQFILQAKEYGRTLGVARDWDVFTGTTVPQILMSSTFEKEDARVLETLLSGARSKKRAAKAGVHALARSPDFSFFCLDLIEALSVPSWQIKGQADLSQPAMLYAEKALDKRLEKVMVMGADLANAPAHARHPLRVELKKLRYAIHAFRPLYPKERRKPYLSALSKLQDEFGILNDAVVARGLALSAAAPEHRDQAEDIRRALGASFVAGWSAQQLDGQAEAVFQAWREFAAMYPFWREPLPENDDVTPVAELAENTFSAGDVGQ